MAGRAPGLWAEGWYEGKGQAEATGAAFTWQYCDQRQGRLPGGWQTQAAIKAQRCRGTPTPPGLTFLVASAEESWRSDRGGGSS